MERDLMARRYDFASDNVAGAMPEAIAALAAANQGFAPGYGADAVTARRFGPLHVLLGDHRGRGRRTGGDAEGDRVELQLCTHGSRSRSALPPVRMIPTPRPRTSTSPSRTAA